MRDSDRNWLSGPELEYDQCSDFGGSISVDIAGTRAIRTALSLLMERHIADLQDAALTNADRIENQYRELDISVLGKFRCTTQ